jgi:hypothetical protein
MIRNPIALKSRTGRERIRIAPEKIGKIKDPKKDLNQRAWSAIASREIDSSSRSL